MGAFPALEAWNTDARAVFGGEVEVAEDFFVGVDGLLVDWRGRGLLVCLCGGVVGREWESGGGDGGRTMWGVGSTYLEVRAGSPLLSSSTS